MFITTIGPAVDAQNVVNRHFKSLLRHAGLPTIAGTISATPAQPSYSRAVPTLPTPRSYSAILRCSSP